MSTKPNQDAIDILLPFSDIQHFVFHPLSEYFEVDLNHTELRSFIYRHLKNIKENPKLYLDRNCNFIALIGYILKGHIQRNPDDELVLAIIEIISIYIPLQFKSKSIKENLNASAIACEILFMLGDDQNMKKYQSVLDGLLDQLIPCKSLKTFINKAKGINGAYLIKINNVNIENNKLNGMRMGDLQIAWRQACNVMCQLDRIHVLLDSIKNDESLRFLLSPKRAKQLLIMQPQLGRLRKDFNELYFPKIKSLATFLHDKSVKQTRYQDYSFNRYAMDTIYIHSLSSFSALYYNKIGIVSEDQSINFTHWEKILQSLKSEYDHFEAATKALLSEENITKMYEEHLKLTDYVLHMSHGLMISAASSWDSEKYKIREKFDELMDIKNDMAILLSNMNKKGLLSANDDMEKMIENGEIWINNKDLTINEQDKDWDDHLFLAVMTTSIKPKNYHKTRTRKHSLSSIICDGGQSDNDGDSEDIEEEKHEIEPNDDSGLCLPMLESPDGHCDITALLKSAKYGGYREEDKTIKLLKDVDWCEDVYVYLDTISEPYTMQEKTRDKWQKNSKFMVLCFDADDQKKCMIYKQDVVLGILPYPPPKSRDLYNFMDASRIKSKFKLGLDETQRGDPRQKKPTHDFMPLSIWKTNIKYKGNLDSDKPLIKQYDAFIDKYGQKYSEQ